MSGQWWESNPIVGPFSNITEANAWAAANPSSLFQGLLATINGVPYSWNGTGWGSTSNVAPCYDTWDLAVAAAGSTLGWTGYVKRLCGNGYFHVMHNGTRLAVSPGESIICDAGPASAGYDLTATGTAYVALASYTIPAGLIGDGEEWEGDLIARNNGTLIAGADYPMLRIAGSGFLTNNTITAANRVCRNRGAFVRLGGTIALRVGSTDIYTNQTSNDTSIDLSFPQSIDAGFNPGSAGNVSRIRQWTFRRIG